MKRQWHNFRLANLTAMHCSYNDEKMKEKLCMKINCFKEKLGRFLETSPLVYDGDEEGVAYEKNN